MKRLMNSLRGTARVRVEGAFPERLINLCAQNRVEFWAVDWRDESVVEFTLRLAGLQRLLELSDRVGCEVTVLARRGVPMFLRAFRCRYGFLIGLALTLCAVSLLSRFVLTVEVTGNERVPDGVILQQLQRFGVRPGAYGPGLDRRQIEQEILLELKELSWMTINLHGTRVEVAVREGQPAPERVDESGFYHVVAEADGIVVRVEAELGDALVKAGDLVAKGDVLISGTVTMEPPIYSDLPPRYYDTHARGRVWCRTWRTLTVVIPLETQVKAYTGVEKALWSIIFFGKRTEIFGNSSIPDGFCDKITSVRQVALSEGEYLPIWLTREEFRAYELESAEVQLDVAEMMLQEQLLQQLTGLIGADGEILQTQFRTRVKDGLIRVELTAECLEEIGTEIPAQTTG